MIEACSMLCERLRSLCQTQGLLPLFGRKGLEPPQVQRESAFWRGAPMSREAMDLLFGSLPRNRLTCKDKREGYAWVYYFKEPETALLHLISHPAFGAGVGLLPEVVQNSIRVAAAVLNFVGFHPTEQPGPGRFVVVLLTWQSPRSPDDFAIPDLHEDLLLSETTLPVGPDLAQEADAARRRTMLSPRAASWPLDQLLQSVLCKTNTAVPMLIKPECRYSSLARRLHRMLSLSWACLLTFQTIDAFRKLTHPSPAVTTMAACTEGASSTWTSLRLHGDAWARIPNTQLTRDFVNYFVLISKAMVGLRTLCGLWALFPGVAWGRRALQDYQQTLETEESEAGEHCCCAEGICKAKYRTNADEAEVAVYNPNVDLCCKFNDRSCGHILHAFSSFQKPMEKGLCTKKPETPFVPPRPRQDEAPMPDASQMKPGQASHAVQNYCDLGIENDVDDEEANSAATSVRRNIVQTMVDEVSRNSIDAMAKDIFSIYVCTRWAPTSTFTRVMEGEISTGQLPNKEPSTLQLWHGY
eukprot:s2671_g1.t1